MSMTIKNLAKLMEKTGFKIYKDTEKERIVLLASGNNGKFMYIVLLQNDGTFFQLRTLGYLKCPPDSNNLETVLKIMSDINYKTKLVKFCWDHIDGEIVVFADAWLADDKLSTEQLKKIVFTCFVATDIYYPRIKKAIDTGQDSEEAASVEDDIRV